jgi:hypothetical protein
MQIKAKFPLGIVVATPGALKSLGEIETGTLLMRHAFGDWGDLSEDDKGANGQALLDGDRLLSSYKSISGKKIWIITEADRSATTVLLPEEY